MERLFSFLITITYISFDSILWLALKLTIRFEVFMQLPSVSSFLHKVDLISSQSWNFNSNNIGDKILFYYPILLILKYNYFPGRIWDSSHHWQGNLGQNAILKMKRKSSKDEVSKLSCFSSIPFWYEGKVQSRQRNKLLFKMTKTHKKNKQFSKSYGLLYSENEILFSFFFFYCLCLCVKPVFWPSLNWLLIRPKTLNWRRGKLF